MLSRRRKNQGQNLKDKVLNYMESVVIDVWDYESLIHESVKKYIQQVARDYTVGEDEVYIRITKPKEIKVYLHIQARLVRELSVRELVVFFTGCEPTQQLEHQVTAFTDAFIADCKQHPRAISGKTQILISCLHTTTLVRVFDDQNFLKHVPVKALLAFFKSR